MTSLQRVNLIVVLNKEKTHLLMCLRQKNPYKGQYNFVGGKVTTSETSIEGAYRELFEETNISSNDITIAPLFYTTYYDGLTLEVFSGVLNHEVIIKEEANPLLWVRLNSDFSTSHYAGDGNVQHIVAVVKELYSL